MEVRNSRELVAMLGTMLLQLALGEEELAAGEAAATPYWAAFPASVVGHRQAAAALRARAESLLAAS